jgi:hypothetical protein
MVEKMNPALDAGFRHFHSRCPQIFPLFHNPHLLTVTARGPRNQNSLPLDRKSLAAGMSPQVPTERLLLAPKGRRKGFQSAARRPVFFDLEGVDCRIRRGHTR